MSLFLNILWVLFGGFFMGLAWFFYGLLAAITIIGIPWARACFNIGWFVIWPFGREAVSRKRVTGEEDIGTGALRLPAHQVYRDIHAAHRQDHRRDRLALSSRSLV